MKIFALNLSLQFEVKGKSGAFEFETVTFPELMGYFFKGPDFDGQQFYVEGTADAEFARHVFDLQANNIWRDLNATVVFLFASESKLEDFIDYFLQNFRGIDAAGGVVVNEKGEYLFIYNRNKWTLPKGKVEWGEDRQEAAIREVQEETGIGEVEITHEMPPSYHSFRRGKKWVLKTTYWYKMTASSKQELTPQEEERIEAVEWKSKEEWLEVAGASYPLIRNLFQEEFSKSLI